MPTIDERKDSRFLTKESVGSGKLLTIKGWHEDEVGNPPVSRDCLDFYETDKPLVLNTTKKEMVAHVTGTREMNEWSGHKIVLFHDPSITLQGRGIVGGIGVRAPRIAPMPPPPGPLRPPAPKPAPTRPVALAVTDEEIQPEGDDSVPF